VSSLCRRSILYPAHLHIDFYEPYRRMGLGSKIMNVYFDYLRGLGIKGVHLGTSSFTAPRCRFMKN